VLCGREEERENKNGFRVRDLREEGGGGRSPPHAGKVGLDRGQGASQWAEGGGGEVRGDLHLRRTREAEDEVHALSPQAHEHQTLSRPHSLPGSRQDLLAHRSRVSVHTLFTPLKKP